MTTKELFELMDELLSDKKIYEDFHLAISSQNNLNIQGDRICIEIDETQIDVPIDVNIEVITKAIFKEYTDLKFGTYKAMIAVGGITKQEYGIIIPKFFFATLYYDDDCNLQTLDFHCEIR